MTTPAGLTVARAGIGAPPAGGGDRIVAAASLDAR